MGDVRLAVRALRATPIVSIVAALSLALGIGANTAIFSLVNSLLLRTLPVKEPQRLVTISSDAAIRMGFKAGLGWNYAMWDRFRLRAQPFDGAVAWTPQRISLAKGGESQPVEGLIVSGDFFTALGVPALLGRTFTSADDVRGGGPDGPVAVISYGLWQRRFGGSAGVVGSSLPVEGVSFTIVGVTPPELFGLEVGKAFDLALPLGTEPLIRGKKASIDQPRSFFLFIMLRLRPGQSLDAATATIRAIQPDIIPPDVPPFVKGPFTLVPAAVGADTPDSVRARYERSLLTIFVVVALVLLIAAANIANLQLARATARRHEFSVRLALGAPHWRLARQLLTESLVLAAIGAVGGLVFAVWASRVLVAQLSTSVTPVALDLSLDWRVLAFTAAVTCVTAVLSGTAPAFRAGRVAPIEALKDYGRSASGDGGRMTLANGLVVAQVALSLVLVVAAGLFVRTLERLASVPLGFDRDRNGSLRSIRDEAAPSIFVPLAQSSNLFAPDRTAIAISIRTAAGSPALLAHSVGAALTAVDPDVSFSVRLLADYLDASLAQERMVAMLAGFFGVLALLLAALGLYGMTSYAVSRRRAEIGIRLALGAAPAAVIRLVLTRVAWLVGAGVLVGAVASVWLSQSVAALLYGLEPHDAITLMSAALALGAVGALAGWLPAFRAARIDPAAVLRES